MTLEALTSVAQRPKEPRETGSDRSWLEIENSLGTALPTDYKEYINLYGTGELGGMIWIYNAFSNSPTLNLLIQAREVLDIWRETRSMFGEECPYPLYPEPNGLLPWGHVDTGAELFWQTSGSPDQWSVVVNESRGPEFQKFEESMSGFLTSLFAGRLKSAVLPRSLLRKRKRVSFLPLKE
ncbi:MAG TPA: SMI1/KNR4 family protein [Chloroflexia bacterium]|nr:SMI1/KNR4 family protein [Chloroflexia bacterium]